MLKKRAMVYFFYDKDGIIDEYVIYFIKNIAKFVNSIIFVSNGEIEEKSMIKISESIDNIEVIERENTGFDVWAYREGMYSIGWSKLEEYDELILANYTIMGPLNNFDDMFADMDRRTDLDFWGITKHHEVNFDAFGTCKYGYIPEHIQSSFIVIRNRMLRSEEYKEFWDNMPQINSYSDSVGLYEAIFTKDFSDMGFKHEVYVNTEDLREYTRYPLMMMSDELVIKRKCPVIKRKSFSQSYYDILSETIGAATLNMYRYVKDKSGYDVNLIWDNILRCYHMSDIKEILHLDYVIPHNVVKKNIENEKKVAIVIHIYFLDELPNVFAYVQNIPEHFHVFVTTDKLEKKEEIDNYFEKLKCTKYTSTVIENRGRDVSALLVGFKEYVNDYDYVCFVHDKKTSQIRPFCVGEGFSYKCFENVLGTRETIENIINLFEENNRLGLLSPPPPNHSEFYQTLYSCWANNYENTCKLLKKYNIDVPAHWSKEPIAPLGTMFWFKTDAFKALFELDWKYSDFPEEPNGNDGTILHAVERAYPYFAQKSGYYSAWCMNSEFSQIEIGNLYYMLKLSVKANHSNTMSSDANFDMIKNLKVRNVVKIKLKDKTHPKIWGFLKKIYKIFK